MRKKTMSVVMAAAVSVLVASSGWAVTVSREAQRHFDRGTAAVEMAKTPEDYELAIDEFKRASALAPDWPDAYYNLGLVQDKAGKYRDEVDSLRKYLRLAPNSPDASQVRTLINKAEFKAEQVLTDDDVLNIYVSLADLSRWQFRGISKADLFSRDKWVRSIRREGPNSLYIVSPGGHRGSIGVNAKLSGKSLEFGTIYSICADNQDACTEGRRYYMEVISRNKVKVRMKYWYPKIMGGGTDEALFEFVRR